MLELFIAFSAGLLSFLSPCVLPLIPGYISYISGSSLNELVERKNINLIPIIFFTLGFSIVFIIFGAAATYIGKLLLNNSNELRIFAGLIIIIFSLQYVKEKSDVDNFRVWFKKIPTCIMSINRILFINQF